MTNASLPLTTLARPVLPEPARERWQPLRLGLVELFHYDSEEFWFHDGHLLLRGNNGTGKSKVLSLTLPFLLDAHLRSSRVEPDGDSGKKMAWNLLMNAYSRRIGYTWIEFGRMTADGPRYLTLGAGLSAVEGRPKVDSWYFILEGTHQGADPRIGRDLWLTSDQQLVLTRERLGAVIEGRGNVYENAQTYRRAVDERLFQLGPKRYEALMDTLIQLRQPQLSKKPDEAGLSHALSEALPPIPHELLADVAEALNQLEEDRRQLEGARQLAQAVGRFDLRYRVYAGTLTRRQARELRQAQTSFDKASEERNKAQAALAAANSNEATLLVNQQTAADLLNRSREHHATLQSDPANADANRLTQAKQDADDREAELKTAQRLRNEASHSLDREVARSTESQTKAETAKLGVNSSRNACALQADLAGMSQTYGENPIAYLDLELLAQSGAEQVAEAAKALRESVGRRRENIRHIEQCLAAVTLAEQSVRNHRSMQLERQTELEDAVGRRMICDETAEAEAAALIEKWVAYADALTELQLDGYEHQTEMAAWVAKPEGESPMDVALAEANRIVSLSYAHLQSKLEALETKSKSERAELQEEQLLLLAGKDTEPTVPPRRAPEARVDRVGTPFWKLVDFREKVDARERAGLEAALEVSGLLDAWVSPEGQFTDSTGAPLLDLQFLTRAPAIGVCLGDWLEPSFQAESGPVSIEYVQALLMGIACDVRDNLSAEAWISPEGRFRLGGLSGAWTKPEAAYIGQAARARARQGRLEEIVKRFDQLDQDDAALHTQKNALDATRALAEGEARNAPSELPLRESILAIAASQREVVSAKQRLENCEGQLRSEEQDLQAATTNAERDANDLNLPGDTGALAKASTALERFNDSQHLLVQVAGEWRGAWPERTKQLAREAEVRAALSQRDEALGASQAKAEKADTRFTTLRDSVGLKVDALLKQLIEALRVVTLAEQDLETKRLAAGQAAEARAVAATNATTADGLLEERTSARAEAVERLHRFAESSLLASALPDLALPSSDGPWTIESALNVARRAEQALGQVQDDEASWTRVQRQVSEDLVELQRSLSALGHQASAEPNDWGFVVHITYQNRMERPDRLLARLNEDIAQRSELLSAKEREVLENHLQAEIASEVQRLMRSADSRVEAINNGLAKRPTSTGVRFRLQWQALGHVDGAPVGLTLARERLLNTSADLWTAEDRKVVGNMLQEQIALERARADVDASAAGSSLIDQLAHALDYRRWHRFRVERKQDGHWRKLSGPASSGERALGLTVPLFAAISSFYGEGASLIAPRLMLLDEAFAGIDDLARAHCMGLVREFDLDFVITSEREWACYAELPGVSICQLQRREGVDAVHVSRWTWDGRAKRRTDDPDRRFPPK